MAYEADYVKYEVDGHVATITMNRPERLNAFGEQIGDEIGGAWMEAMADDSVRCVILTGEGRIFCAGRDIREQAEKGGLGRSGPSRAEVLGLYLVPETDKPIISAVRGGAWGAGWYMCCGSDIVVAADDARFAMSELPTGIIGPAFVPILNNPALAARLRDRAPRPPALRRSAATSSASSNHVVPSDDVMKTARELADEVAGLPPVHVQVTKQQLMMARPRPHTYQAEIAFPQAMQGLMQLDDTREGGRRLRGEAQADLQGPLRPLAGSKPDAGRRAPPGVSRATIGPSARRRAAGNEDT